MSRAIVIRQIGGPEVLEVEDQEVGAPGPGCVRVCVRAAGVNFIDIYFRSGQYARPVPFVSGLEGSGVVEAVGPDAEDLVVGDRVAWAAIPNSYAEQMIAPVSRLVRIPEGIDDEVAAACMLQGMTAHYLTHGVRDTRPGDVALVHAAAGGTGQLLVQTLKNAGARVLATCSTAEKEKVALDAGADSVIRYTECDFAEAVRELTQGRGVDVAYDSVGQTTFDGSLASLRVRGLLVLFGQASGPVPPVDLRRLNDMGSLYVTRPSLAHYTGDRAELVMRAGAVLDAVRDRSLRVAIGGRFPLADAAAAHRALQDRTAKGKLLLLP